jgi:LysM domain-containing protein
MSVMTAGEQRRRAGAARGHRTAAAVPGQPNVTAGPWPGAGTLVGRPPARRPSAGGALAGPAAGVRPAAGWPTADRPEPAGARPPVRTRVRLTRRGRIVVAALLTMVVLLVAALAWLAGAARADAAGSGVPSRAVYHSLHSVVVEPGQSLWSIAVRYDPTADPRGVIQQIIDLNALSGTSVQPGQHLWLPRG